MIPEINDPVRMVDIARRLHVTAPAVANWVRRPLGFPAPRGRVGDTRTRETVIWEWEDVKAWYGARVRTEERVTMSRELIGYCPVHPDATDKCRCCKSAITVGDLYEAKPVGMGLWICANNHQTVGAPLIYNEGRESVCTLCGEKLYHIVSGVWQAEDR